MIDYYNGQITDILPANFTREPRVKALSYALQQGCRLLQSYSKKLYIYPEIDTQPHEVLDILAAELRTQYYKDTLDIEAKRNLVKNTLAWYMTAGTPKAVGELVAAVFGSGSVQEWFEYGGDPYYFKVKTDAPLAVTPEKDRVFYDMLEKIKNARSHLQAVEVYRESRQTTCAGVGQCGYTRAPAIAAYTGNIGGDENAADI